ncbi:MAG: hypothetical protein IJF17_04365 [Thermoguttaceae bacterium]|nr:hypothetical protein [Thermoguttaceae bacterium]
MSEWTTSLCQVYKDGKNDLWLSRQADIQDGNLKELVKPQNAKRYEYSFYYSEKNDKDRPMPLNGEWGIWEWNIFEEEKETKTQSRYLGSPIEMINIPNASSPEDVMKYLKENGVQELHAKKILFYYFGKPDISGLLCNDSDLENVDNSWKLKGGFYTLPICQIDPRLKWCKGGQTIEFYSKLEIKAKGVYPTQSKQERIKEKIQELYRNYLKDNETRKNRQTCVKILEEDGYKTVVERFAEDFAIDIKEAEKDVNDFINNIKSYISKKEFEDNILEKSIRNNPNLTEFCRELGRKLLEEEKSEEIKKHQKEIDESKRKVKESHDHYQKIHKEQGSIEEQKSKLAELEKLRNSLQTQIDEAKEKGFGLLRELAEVSPEFAGIMFAGRQNSTRSEISNWAFKEGEVFSEEDPEEYTDCKDVCSLFQENLEEMGIVNAQYLSAFLCAAYWLKMPILLAGPCGELIAEAFSISLRNRYPDILDCSSEFSPAELGRALENEENILIVKSPFHGVWFDHLASSLMPASKCIVFLSPNVDDLSIEPRGIFSYLIPIVTEIFLGETKNEIKNISGGKATDNFKLNLSEPTDLKKPDLFKKLKMNPIAIRKYRKLLPTMQNFLSQKEEETDLEQLFGLFPYACLTRQLQNLQKEDMGWKESKLGKLLKPYMEMEE